MLLTWGEKSRCSTLCVSAEKMARKIYTRLDVTYRTMESLLKRVYSKLLFAVFTSRKIAIF